MGGPRTGSLVLDLSGWSVCIWALPWPGSCAGLGSRVSAPVSVTLFIHLWVSPKLSQVSCVHLRVSPKLEPGFLWPHFSNASKKSCWIFSVRCFSQLWGLRRTGSWKMKSPLKPGLWGETHSRLHLFPQRSSIALRMVQLCDQGKHLHPPQPTSRTSCCPTPPAPGPGSPDLPCPRQSPRQCGLQGSIFHLSHSAGEGLALLLPSPPGCRAAPCRVDTL